MHLIILSLFISLQSLNPISQPKQLLEYKQICSVDMSKYAVLPEDQEAIRSFFGEGCRFTKLENADFIEIDTILKKAIEKREKKGGYDLVRNPDTYYKQVIAGVNEKGEKEVYLNCLCSVANKKDWKKVFIMVLDGGNCYFQVRINLKTKKIISFVVNGLA